VWIVTGALFLFLAGLLSYAGGKDWPPLHRKPLQFAALAGFFGLWFLTIWLFRSETGVLALLFMLPILFVGVGLAYRFLRFLIGDWFETAHRFGIGLDRMTIEKSYDRAEKAERERDLEGAIRLYREETGRDPADPEPWRRIGEIEVRRGRMEHAVEPLRAALTRLHEPEPRATAAFRLADVLRHLNRTDEARALIEGIGREFPGTRIEGFAKERLKNLEITGRLE